VTESGRGPNDDDLLPSEPFADPRGRGLDHGSSGYAGGLRHAKAGRRARRMQIHKERRDAAHVAYVAAARVMGAAVVAAAAVAVLVFAGVFPGPPGSSAGHRTATLEQSSGTTTPTPPPAPSTTAEIEPPPLPPADPVAIGGTTARSQIPARPSGHAQPEYDRVVELDGVGAVVLGLVALFERRAYPGDAV
jgi:hypothetical protein